MKRIALALAAALAFSALAAPSHATLNACAAAKKACVAKKVAALLKCHGKNEKPPVSEATARSGWPARVRMSKPTWGRVRRSRGTGVTRVPALGGFCT